MKLTRHLIILGIIISFLSCTSSPDTEKSGLSLDEGLDNLSDQFSYTLGKSQKSTIAILDFVDLDGSSSMLGKYIREELTIRLFRSGDISVVERSLLDSVLKEWNLGTSGVISEGTAAEIGNILGVDAITTGTITDLGSRIKVNARIIDVESGALLSVASESFFKDESVMALLGESLNHDTFSQHESASQNEVIRNELEEYYIEADGYRFMFNRAEYKAGEKMMYLYGKITSINGIDQIDYSYNSLVMITEEGINLESYNVVFGGVTAEEHRRNEITMAEGIGTTIMGKFKLDGQVPESISQVNVEFYDIESLDVPCYKTPVYYVETNIIVE
ncbi:MAG: FlgO family outer membrane protein [Spirochaetales bacterium]|nr:FlgO family outer membrane protein [Spirochaetales bacterium]